MNTDSNASSRQSHGEQEPTLRSETALLSAFLADCSAPCRKCGFDLHGLKGTRCPECGGEVRLCLEGPPGHHRQFLVGVVSLAMALGGCVVVVLAGILQALVFGSGGNRRLAVDFGPAHMLAAMLLFPLFALALLSWLLCAIRIDRLSGAARTAAAGGCVAAFIGLGVLFGILG